MPDNPISELMAQLQESVGGRGAFIAPQLTALDHAIDRIESARTDYERPPGEIAAFTPAERRYERQFYGD